MESTSAGALVKVASGGMAAGRENPGHTRAAMHRTTGK